MVLDLSVYNDDDDVLDTREENSEVIEPAELET